MLLADGQGVDVIGEGLPNWIMAITGVLTLGAAIAAALFARSAATHAGAQAREAEKQTAEARRQAEMSERQNVLTQRTIRAQAQDARRQEETAMRAERRSREARLDERIPFVIARAELDHHNLFARSPDGEDWLMVLDETRIDFTEAPAFLQQVRVSFENVSSMPARIDIVDPASGEFPGLPAGAPVVVSPGSSLDLVWTRIVPGPALFNEGYVDDPAVSLFDVHFWVRDLAMLARDEYAFNGSLRHFSLDGSQLIVNPNVKDTWPGGENIAGLFPDRVYERLDADNVRRSEAATTDHHQPDSPAQ